MVLAPLVPMRELLDLLHDREVDAYGVAHPNGTVQLTLRGDPDRVALVVGRFADSLLDDWLDQRDKEDA